MNSKIITNFFSFFTLILLFDLALSNEFSERKNFNRLLNGFFKNDIHQCSYVNKSWSTGFESYPYGMVNNSGAFKNILVFKHKNIIGTLWPNIGEISLERGVRKFQIWKKKSNEEYEMINSDYLSDNNANDINIKSPTNSQYKTYFDTKGLKIGIKPWITDFYGCELIDSSNFARKKLIDIFVNQNDYVKKDFAFREKNPSLFTNIIELISD